MRFSPHRSVAAHRDGVRWRCVLSAQVVKDGGDVEDFAAESNYVLDVETFW